MFALAFLIAMDVLPMSKGTVAYITEDAACRRYRSVVAVGTGTSYEEPAWTDVAKTLPAWSEVVIIAASPAQLALERGAFIKLIDAQIDAVRAKAPRAWIILAAPDDAKQNARTWLNAIVHKRGDARMSFVIVPLPSETRQECFARMELLVREIKTRL